LLGWYRRSHRDMPWRQLRDPYAIWVSEIMLQQTRVDTVKAYFERFMARFPTVAALAAAPADAVLELWSGLGYYARARNLHAAAAEIVARYGGEFPQAESAVRALPGIGPYTAGAILSIAFGQQVALLDGNVIRVLSRLRAVAEGPDTALGKRLYWSLSAALVPPPSLPAAAVPDAPGDNDPGDFNQALMELGATVCVPQRPLCLVCPLVAECAAHRRGQVELYPPKKAPRAVPVVEVVTLVLRCRGQVLLLRRPAAGLWGGLWEPATLPREPGESEEAALGRLGRERLGLDLTALPAQPLGPFVHVLTHREMRFTPRLIDWPDAELLPFLRLSGYEEARLVEPRQPLALGLSAWVTTLLGRLAAAPTIGPVRHRKQ
jgi:A/G-specific adenine glycosylase